MLIIKTIYKDISSPNGLRIKFEPENVILSAFFSSLKVIKFPEYIFNGCISVGFGAENTSVKFYNEMDWEDFAELGKIGGIQKGEVNIYFYDGKPNETVLNERTFDKILYDYSTKLLEVYRDSKEVPEGWEIEMESAIKKLKQKIES